MNGRTKEFLAYVVPSVLAFALSGVYTIVDGFFVGQSLGDIGLAAITLDSGLCFRRLEPPLECATPSSGSAMQSCQSPPKHFWRRLNRLSRTVRQLNRKFINKRPNP